MPSLYEIKQQSVGTTAGSVLSGNITVNLAGLIVAGTVTDSAGTAVKYAPVLLIGTDTVNATTEIIAQTLTSGSAAQTQGRYILGIPSVTLHYTVEVSTNIYI